MRRREDGGAAPDERPPVTYRPIFSRLAGEVLVGAALAVVAAAIWAAVGEAGFRFALARTLVVVAGMWLLGGGTVASRTSVLDYMQWGVGVSDRELTSEEERPHHAPVELNPAVSAILVALVLAGVGSALR